MCCRWGRSGASPEVEIDLPSYGRGCLHPARYAGTMFLACLCFYHISTTSGSSMFTPSTQRFLWNKDLDTQLLQNRLSNQYKQVSDTVLTFSWPLQPADQLPISNFTGSMKTAEKNWKGPILKITLFIFSFFFLFFLFFFSLFLLLMTATWRS